MSVSVASAAVFHTFGGQPDQRLPAGFWLGTLLALGNASLGQIQMSITLESNSGPGGIIYGLRKISSQRGDGISENPSLSYRAITPLPLASTTVAPLWALETFVTARLATTHVATHPFPKQGHEMIGQRDVASGSAAEIVLVWPTNTNFIGYELVAEGLFWLTAANRLPGGPQLPEAASIPIPIEPGQRSFYDELRAGKRKRPGFHTKAKDGSWVFTPRDEFPSAFTMGPRSLGL